MILALYTQVQEAENKSEKRKRNDNNNVHAQSHPTLSDPMDCSPPDSSVHGIPQVGILEWVVISFSKGSSTYGLNPHLPRGRQILYR